MRRTLWTLVPIGSLGLLGWVPPLRIAVRKQTPAAWLWFAGSVAAVVLVIVLVTTVRSTSGAKDSPPSWVGMIEILNIISTAVYTGIASKALVSKTGLSGPEPRFHTPYAPYNPYTIAPAPTVVLPAANARPPAAALPALDPAAAPLALDPAAAEVQAELRQLRNLLGESAGGRERE